MCKASKKLPAFTIIELMVTMLISSIALGLIYTGYEIVSKQYKSYKISNEIIAEALYLNAIMNIDFANARDVKRNDEGFELIDYLNRITIYELSEEYIVRKVSFSTDTFHIPVQQITYSMLGSEIMDEETILIDEVSFYVTVNKETHPFHYKKQYDAAFLMEREKELAE
jgi:prepilin-type N-terminal cleavage/methylation domain-containing protein